MKSKFRVIIKLLGLAAIGMLGIVSIIASNDGGSGHGDVPPPDTFTTAGLWHGTITDGENNVYSIGGITSTDGQFRLIIDEGECIGMQLEGTFSMDGDTGSGDFTGYAGGLCTFNNLETIISGTVEFTVNGDGDTLTGTFVSQDDSGTFNLTYDPQVETPITLADLEGSWLVAEGDGDFSEITIFNDGGFGGDYFPYNCKLMGAVSIIDPELSITSVSFVKSNCDAENMNGTYTGLGVLVFDEDSQNDLFAIIVSSDTLSNFGFFTPAP
jgi:hypothetical protein